LAKVLFTFLGGRPTSIQSPPLTPPYPTRFQSRFSTIHCCSESVQRIKRHPDYIILDVTCFFGDRTFPVAAANIQNELSRSLFPVVSHYHHELLTIPNSKSI